MGRIYFALWWVEAGHIPSVTKAKQRLNHLNEHGVSHWAFNFKYPFPSPDQVPEEFAPPPFDSYPAL
ncbi:DUF3291 domain-containing protein [Calothrix sp. NIES-3974]|uniref:DUF3291 domain-containing protein n=1 Tax=Calothrix sp. NIES-3974 TaxID=2005462 RepID=UPI000BBC2A85